MKMSDDAIGIVPSHCNVLEEDFTTNVQILESYKGGARGLSWNVSAEKGGLLLCSLEDAASGVHGIELFEDPLTVREHHFVMVFSSRAQETLGGLLEDTHFQRARTTSGLLCLLWSGPVTDEFRESLVERVHERITSLPRGFSDSDGAREYLEFLANLGSCLYPSYERRLMLPTSVRPVETNRDKLEDFELLQGWALQKKFERDPGFFCEEGFHQMISRTLRRMKLKEYVSKRDSVIERLGL